MPVRQNVSSLSGPAPVSQVWQTFLAKGASGLLILAPTVNGERLQDVFAHFDVMQAQATQPADRDRILAAIDASIGAAQLNVKLRGALVESAVYEANHASAPPMEKSRIFDKAACLLRANAQYEEALHMYRHAMEISDKNKMFAFDLFSKPVASTAAVHPARLESLHNQATCLFHLARFDEALPLYQEALNGRKSLLGARHAKTVLTSASLQACRDRMGSSA